jgi:predicted metal-dependent peptidase
VLLPGPDKEAYAIIHKGSEDFVLRFPFGGLLVLGQFVQVVQNDTLISTLATDGKSIFYNAEYIKKVYDSEGIEGITFRLCHEYLHVYFNHPERGVGREHDLWNFAIDVFANRHTEEILSTTNNPWETPKDGINPRPWGRFSTAEELYDHLCQQAKSGKMSYPEDVYGSGGAEFGGKDVLPPPFETEDEKHEWQEGITEEICQAHHVYDMNQAAKPLPGAIRERLAKIKEGKVPWSRLLAGRLLCDLGDDVATFSPPRKRLYPILILPRYMGLQERKLVLAIDNSTSVGEDLHSEFKSAVMPAARRAHEIHVLGFDAIVRETLITRKPEDIRRFKYEQGGHTHTSVVGVFDYVHKIRPSAVAVLTDGYIELPKEPFHKTVWCTPVGGQKQPWGTNYTMDVAW